MPITAGRAFENLRTDHRAIEERLDTLLAALLYLTPERVPEIQATVSALQDLAAMHFEKEEGIVYPALRPLIPDLLSRMDEQHEEVRQVEEYVAELLADPPERPAPRWLNELRSFGIELHDLIQHHIVEEEEELFRLGDERLNADEQERLAAAVEAVQCDGADRSVSIR